MPVLQYQFALVMKRGEVWVLAGSSVEGGKVLSLMKKGRIIVEQPWYVGPAVAGAQGELGNGPTKEENEDQDLGVTEGIAGEAIVVDSEGEKVLVDYYGSDH